MAASRGRKKPNIRTTAIKAGFRSGLEHEFSKLLIAKNINHSYEKHKLSFIQPESSHKYVPDFHLPDYNLFIETKGRLQSSERKKMLLVVEQHPDKNFLFVFGQPNNTISKTSKTTYTGWCKKNNIKSCGISEFDKYLKGLKHAHSVQR